MPPGQSSHLSTRGRLVSQSTQTLRHSTNKPPHRDAPTTVQRGKRSTAASVPAGERLPTQSHSNITSVGAPGCLTPAERTVHVVLHNAAVVPRSHSCVRVCFCNPRSDRWCSPQRDKYPALSPLSRTSLANFWVFVFRSPFANRHQRLQPLNLSFRFPHSLCNAVGEQYSHRCQHYRFRRKLALFNTIPLSRISLKMSRFFAYFELEKVRSLRSVQPQVELRRLGN